MPSPERRLSDVEGPARLRPREHGAYAMLAFPAVSGLVSGGLTWGGAAFVATAVMGFVAHEAALVVLGGRGERLRTRHEHAARARLGLLGGAVVLAAAVFLATAPSGAWGAAVVSGALGAAVGGLVVLGKTKTLAGEVMVATAFSSIHAVAAAAGGRAPDMVWLPALAWVASFVLATLAVHALKYRFKKKGPGRWAVVASPTLAGLLAVAGCVGAVSGHPAGWAAATLVPKALVVATLSAVEVHPKHLRRVGWSFVGADVATLALLLWWLGLGA
ncbi:MAG TPA: YwiC-like family protein [Longimicrobiales bacterium]|nr:YwiC-like family protein [Longimicrobiales bacterium]